MIRSFLLSLPVYLQLFITIGATIILAFLIANFSSTFFDMHQLITNTDLISSVYEGMCTIYAILLTFTLWEIWQNFSTADAAVQKEAYTLLNLVYMVESSPEWKIQIREIALQYLYLVTSQEWPVLKSFADHPNVTQEKSHASCVELIKLVQNIVPSGNRETVLFDQSLTLLNKWLDARRARLMIARGNCAKAMWPLLFTGACVLFLFHGLFVAKTLGIWAILLLGVSSVIGLTFYLIFTLDSPFAGSPSVNVEPFELAIGVLERPAT